MLCTKTFKSREKMRQRDRFRSGKIICEKQTGIKDVRAILKIEYINVLRAIFLLKHK